MIKNLRHVGVVVKNLKYSLKFWTEDLNFSLLNEKFENSRFIDKVLNLNESKLKTIKLKCPLGNVLELLHFESHNDDKQNTSLPFHYGLTHIAVTVGDVEKLYNDLKKKGFTFLSEPQFSPDKKVKLVFGRGPENLLIEFVEELRNGG